MGLLVELVLWFIPDALVALFSESSNDEEEAEPREAPPPAKSYDDIA